VPLEELLIRPIDTIPALPILIGLGTLTLGAMVYLTDRPPESAWLIDRLSGHVSLKGGGSPVFGILGENLPAFAHVFAFSLITAALLNTGGSGYGACVFWFTINTLFELGQARPDILAPFLPPGRLIDYFTKGTFDILDILACAAGALAAAMVLMMLEKRSNRR
jgi:hypothetical protein